MPRRTDFPLGGLRRKAERQRADRERRRKLDRVAQAFELRARARERMNVPWSRTSTSRRTPFSRKPD